jgi:uncharacterized protein (DUF433 family)
MDRTSRSIEAGVATISPSSTSTLSLPTLQHGERNDRQAGEDLGFGGFAAAIREELAPAGVLETVLADRAILAAWQLHAAAQAEADAIERADRRRGRSSSCPARSRALAELRRDAFRAQRALGRAIELLQSLHDRTQPRWGRPPLTASQSVDVPRDEADVDDLDISNEWPIVPPGVPEDADGGTDEPASDDESREDWQGRLVFDFNVSESSPVVKGTWVTVSHVVSLIVDGWTWGDILRTHPELTEDDLRACLSYTVAQDNGEA